MAPKLTTRRIERLRRLLRRLARAKHGSVRRHRLKARIARLKAREVDARKNWVEVLTTRLARTFDVIRVEDLRIADMTRSARGTADRPGRNVKQKAGLNRSILANAWGNS